MAEVNLQKATLRLMRMSLGRMLRALPAGNETKGAAREHFEGEDQEGEGLHAVQDASRARRAARSAR